MDSNSINCVRERERERERNHQRNYRIIIRILLLGFRGQKSLHNTVKYNLQNYNIEWPIISDNSPKVKYIKSNSSTDNKWPVFFVGGGGFGAFFQMFRDSFLYVNPNTERQRQSQTFTHTTYDTMVEIPPGDQKMREFSRYNHCTPLNSIHMCMYIYKDTVYTYIYTSPPCVESV